MHAPVYIQIRSMLTYLEGARFKLQSALLELDHKPRGAHPLAPHIQITRDRTGLQQSVLKVPLWLRNGDESDRLNEEYAADADFDDDSTLNHTAPADASQSDNGTDANGTQLQCVDGLNDVLIKHFDRNFKRSHSNLEATTVVTMPPAVQLLKESNNNHLVHSGSAPNNRHSRRSTSPVFDRGQADGGSNQPDSDFGEHEEIDLGAVPSIEGVFRNVVKEIKHNVYL